MKKFATQGIVVSDKILNIAKDLIEEEQSADILDHNQYPSVVPRTFPNKNIPSKVAVHRKVKQFAAVDINQILGPVNWSLDRGYFNLAHYVFAPQFVLEYGCTQDNINGKKVKGRAYCQVTNRFEQFHVNMFDVQDGVFGGTFLTRDSQSMRRKITAEKVPRSLICFDFEDPIIYITEVQRAVQRRQKVLQIIKYEFYVDNFDLEGAPNPSHKIMHKVKELAKAHVKNDDSIPSGDMMLVVSHYKRVMNELLFRHEVREDQLPIYIPTKYVKKQEHSVGTKKRIKIKKDNKTITLVGRSTKQKVTDLKTKSLLLNNNITQILLYLKQKICLKPKTSLFLPIKETIIQKYLIEQQRSFDYCLSAINQFIVDPLSSEIRNLVKQQPDGWFRLYEESKSTYLQSKLHRLFVLINNIIRDWVVDEIAEGLNKFSTFLKLHTPLHYVLHSISSSQVQMNQQEVSKVFTHVIGIQLIIQKGRLKLSHDSDRVNKLLKRIVLLSLEKLSKVPSPEPIVLKQLLGGYKNQEGIKIELPIHQDSSEKYNRYPKIHQYFLELNKQIDQISQPLIKYERLVEIFQEKIGLNQLLEGRMKNVHRISDIVDGLKRVRELEGVLLQQFAGSGVAIGFFYISYELVKVQVSEMLHSEKDVAQKKLLAENKRLNTIYHQKVREIQRKLEAKPKNVKQLIEKQKLMENLEQTLDQSYRRELLEIGQICGQFGCKIEADELKISIDSQKMVHIMYKNTEALQKEFENMKKQELKIIENGKKDITQSLGLLRMTKDSLSFGEDIAGYVEYAQKVRYLTENLKKLQSRAQEMREKQKLLDVQSTTTELLSQLKLFHKQLQPYDLLWNSVQKWKNLSVIWLNEPIGSYELKEPEAVLKQLITNLKKAAFLFLQRNQANLYETANQIRLEIEQFQPKLQLLRLLKKKGLSRKHFEEIGIELTAEISNLSLLQAIELGLFQKMSQIQAISNDAWNQFSLEQTLDRLLKQIYDLKFKVSSYKDRKKNDILIIVNYKVLIDGIDAVLNNIEAVQFNPMVKMFEDQIKSIYDKSLYISNSLNICKQFQKVLVELHPVFDSTDIVKQIPAENKKFGKVLRIWLELLSYIKSILSVHDSCGSQNIFEKVKSMLNSIEQVKKQLISYLQQKRKGFSRFYLLSNSEMFQLFSATSDINSVNSLIPKLFDSMVRLEIRANDNKIIGVCSEKNCSLLLQKHINYKGVNIENWLNNLEKQIKFSIAEGVRRLIQSSSLGLNWIKIVQEPNTLPQVAYLLYEIFSTAQMVENFGNMNIYKERQSRLLQQLVNKKRTQHKEKLPEKVNILLCSLIILVTSKRDIADRFIRNNIQASEDFEWKKIVKSKFVEEAEKYDRQAVIQTLNYESAYGCQFLGCYSRLVITSLTEKMQIVYFLAQMYSLGGAATGPAGTGKSQTTKDIAKLVGKSCLIFNCSQNFHETTFLRLIKGLAITGLWMCFDEFNRLSFKILSIAAEQLSYLLKFRSYKHRIELSFMGEPIWLEPQFQICITYNPTYQGRRSIPKNLNELFRTVALALPDEFAICQALLFSYGYSKGQQMAKLVTNILKMCRQVWWKQRTYDFGLRALRSIVTLSSTLLISGKENQENSIIESLKILNSPKMSKQDNELFLQIVSKQFAATVLPLQHKNTALPSKLSVFYEIINIRDGVLLCGEPLSGKESTIEKFKAYFKQWEVPMIFHDVLTVDELYGDLDSSTKLWKDGLFTTLVKQNISLGQKKPQCMIVLNGSVYSQWIENLNSFLDATRKLSLSSGETISIPPTLKLVVSCTDLQKASPATITRFGLIKFQPMKNSQIIQKHPKFPPKLLNLFNELIQEVRKEMNASIDERYLLNWVLDWTSDQLINYDSFIFYLAHLYEGLLTYSGRMKFENVCRRYLSVAFSPFELMVKLNGETTSAASQFKKFLSYEQSNEQLIGYSVSSFEQIFIPTLRSYKLNFSLGQFLGRQREGGSRKILMVIGDQDVGKSRIVRKYLESLPKEKHKNISLFFTRNTSCRGCYEELTSNLTRKSSSKLGGNPGVSVNVWIEDVNMPTTNQFDLYQTAELLRLVCSQSEWYNYTSLGKEQLEDIYLLADAKNNYFSYKYPLNINPRLYKHILPIFCAPTTSSELQIIFKSIIEKSLAAKTESSFSPSIIQSFISIAYKAIEFYWALKAQEVFDKNIITFTLNDLYRSLKGFLIWSLPQELSLASEVFQFELSTHIIAKISSKGLKDQTCGYLINSFSQFSNSRLEVQKSSIKLPLFHNLQNNNVSNAKCEKVQNINQFTNRFQCMCDEYKAITQERRSIVVFPEMIEYLVKIYRVLSLDYTHVGIAGMSKCGKTTIVKLASYLISSQMYSIKDSNDNQMKNWQEAIKHASKACYKSKNISLFLIKNKYLGFSWCTEDLNKLLNTMHLPHLYSEADTEEMIYMMQADLVRKNLPTTKESMQTEFVAYLRKKMHVVLLLNPSFAEVKSCLVQYPSISKLCTFFYLDKWPKEALYLIAKLQMPDLGYPLDIFQEIHQYCHKLCELSKLSILDSVWEGMYFDFIAFFIKIYDNNQSLLTRRKNQYEQSRKVIEQTEDQIEKTKNKIKKLQPTIIMIENETAKTVRNLQIQRKNAEEKNKELEIKNVQFEKIIKESRALKEELQQKVQIVNVQIAKAWENVSLIKPNHISEVKALGNPSQFIKTVLTALVILTYDGPLAKEMKDVNGHLVVEESYFETAKKYVLSKDAKAIGRMLTEFKREYVTKEMFQRLEEKCLTYKRWSQKEAKSANKAIYFFFLWVEAVANQYRIYEQTQPLRNELQKISTILHQKEVELSTTKNQLEYYQHKIEEFEAQHKVKKQSLQEYRIQIVKFERMLSRGHELLKQISGEKQKWVVYIGEITDKINHNFGDSIVMATTMVYISPHVFETRKKIRQHINKLCKKRGIPCMVTGLQSCEIPWYISREEQQIFQSFQIHQNEFLIDNIKVAEGSNKVILLVDPEEQGVKLMKKLSWQNLQAPIDKISEYSPNLVKSIQSAILYGRIVFIQIDAAVFNNSLRFLINPILSMEGEQQMIKSGDKTIPIHESYRLYLYTTCYPYGKNKSSNYSMELLTNTQVINFKMTFEQLQQRILETIINTELPLLKAKIQEIYRINIKDTLTLNSIEEKLLVMFSSELSAEQILDSDEIINTVIHSNRLYKQISNRIAESKEQQNQIEQEKKPYYKKSQEACLIYENIQRLKLVHPLYAYSYHWFIDLFQNNVYNFNITLYQQVSKALKPEEKIVVAILIAEILHPNLPWKCLFNVEESLSVNTIYTTHSEEQEEGLRESTVNIFDSVLEKIGIIAKQLPVSQSDWSRIVNRINQVKKFIPTLEDTFNEEPELFLNLVIIPEDRIFEGIPDRYSHLDFYYRILLISCFRPECVLTLLREWIKVNMGNGYAETNPPLSLLISNTKPYRPIITILPDNSLESFQKIKDIYKQSHPKEEQNVPISHFHFASLQQSGEFDTLIKSSLVQNAWVIVESINSIEVLTFIKEYFEELVIMGEKEFRLWVVMEQREGFAFGERFTQFCDKVRINHNKDLYKEMSASFSKYQDLLTGEKDFFERNKKKLMVSQLCILHHLLSQFSDRYSYLSTIYKTNRGRKQSPTQILTLTEWDLKLLIEQMCYYKIEEYSKSILSNQLINKLTYGSQLSTYYLELLLETNSRMIVNGIISERSVFWQTLWCEQKFPKDREEYEHEIKNLIRKKRYMQVFGLDYKLVYKIKVNEYNMICKFYERTVFHQGKGISLTLYDKLRNYNQQLLKIRQGEEYQILQSKMQELKVRAHRNQVKKSIYHFCRIEVAELEDLVEKATKDIDGCLLTLKHQQEIIKDSQTESFLLSLYGNIAPWSLSHRPVSLVGFHDDIEKRYGMLSSYISNHNKIENPVPCSMIENFIFYLNVLFDVWGLDKNVGNFKFVFMPLHSIEPHHIIQQLQSYGFKLPEQKDPYPEETLYSDYGQKLKLATVFKKLTKHTLKSIDKQEASEKGICGFAILEDLYLMNAEIEEKSKPCSLKVQIPMEEDEINLIKPILNLGMSLRNTSNAKSNYLSSSHYGKNAGILNEEKLKGILLILNSPQEFETKKSRRINEKMFQMFEDEERKLVGIPCYEYSLVDVSEDSEPVAILHSLVRHGGDERVKQEMVRRNIHFSLRA